MFEESPGGFKLNFDFFLFFACCLLYPNFTEQEIWYRQSHKKLDFTGEPLTLMFILLKKQKNFLPFLSRRVYN